MKSIRYILFALSLPLAFSASAQEVAGSQVQLDNKTVYMGINKQVMVGMDMTVPADLKLSANRLLTLTPILQSKDSTHNKVLPAVYVYGRTRHIIDRRDKDLPKDAFSIVVRNNGNDQTVKYTARVPYEKWMNGSDVKLLAEVHGCADCLKEEDMVDVAPVLLERYVVKPAVAFVAPPAEEVKNRDVQGKAYLDFPVNQTVIYPDYRRNPEELASIKATIDVVRENPDTEITGITISGYASPEGSYANNTRLAKGRSEALKRYVMEQYALKASLFTVSSTPEDWEGLRKYVAESNLPEKDKLLSIIDSSEKNLDVKEGRIKALGRDVYQLLLEDCYPGLRHSDYVVNYVVRPYNVDEAREIIKTRPQLLSMEEMYKVAQSYDKGSKDFNEVFDIAVRMYPNDPTTNINAAAAELLDGDLAKAERYLSRSDASHAATINNQGVYHLLKGDLDKAEELFKKADSMGVAEAKTNLQEVQKKREDNAIFGEE